MLFINNLLSYILFLPLLGSFLLMTFPSSNKLLLKQSALTISFITFLISLLTWVFFNKSIGTFQFVNKFFWIPILNLNFPLGVDGISLFFLLLTTLLIPLCLLTSWDTVKTDIKKYLILFLVMEFFLIGVFCVLDLLLFYIFFESVLIPMFLIVGVCGSRERKIRAAYQFFVYTLIGSVLMLLAILYIYYQTGTTDVQVLTTINFDFNTQIILWLAFFASLAVKVPMVPSHIWLPEFLLLGVLRRLLCGSHFWIC